MCDPILRIKWCSACHICYCATYMELEHNLSTSSDPEGSQSAQMHACSGCAVASDSGWPTGGRAGQNGDLGHHFSSTSLGCRLGRDLYNTHRALPGPSIAIYRGYTSPPQDHTLNLHQRHGSEHFTSGAVEEDPICRNRRFSSPSWADGACGVRRERGSCSSLSFSCQLQGHFYLIYRIFEKNCMKHLS